MEPTYLTLAEAEGAIEAGPDQQERLNEVTARLQSGEFHNEAEGLIPVICIDGRWGGFHMLPNAAGGTETIFVGDDLTVRRYTSADGTTIGGYTNVMDRIIALGGQVGGHDDEHHSPEGSGCGANDKLPLIYDFMVRKGDAIRNVAGALGIQVTDQLHEKIIGNAEARTSFGSGADMLAALEAQDDEVIVEHLGGAHKEVIAVINTKEGTTLDRQALLDEFGEDYESFNIDVWAFENAARMILADDNDVADETEVSEMVTAMVYYNLATAHVLTGKNLRVITL